MNLLKKENWLFFLYILTMISLVTEARFFLSQAMIWLLLSAILSFSYERKGFFRISDYFKQYWRTCYQYTSFLIVPLFFLMVFCSGLWSDDLSYWGDKLRVRLPFIAIPLAFAWLPSISKRHYQHFYYMLLLLMSVVLVGVLANYALDFQRINATLIHGKNIPVPMNHIRFSLMLALTIVSGTIIYSEGYFWRNAWEQKLIAVLVLFLLLGIHILAVRSGILALYITLGLLGFRYFIILKKAYLQGLIAAIVLAALPLAAYYSMPSIQQKVAYFLLDRAKYFENGGSDYSDSERLGSILVGLHIGNKSPWCGCGYGDLWFEIERGYAVVFPQDCEPKIPHNQLVITYAGLGIVGVVIFLFAFFFPILYHRSYRDWHFLALHILIFISFMVEATIETQVGTAVYTFFLGLGQNHLKGQKQYLS